MRLLILLMSLALFAVVEVSGKKNKWLKEPRIVVLKKENGAIKETSKETTQELTPKKKHHHRHHHNEHLEQDSHKKPRVNHPNFKKTDALPYSSPYSRPYDWNMYTDGPYGWGPARRRRETNSFYLFKRSLYPRNNVPQYYKQPQAMTSTPAQQAAYNNNQPAQQGAYFYQPVQQAPFSQLAAQPYNYQAAENRNNLAQANAAYRPQPLAQPLQKEAPQVQQPRERTWVDKMGVKWTTKKVNDYKWGEREPGIMMDEYAGGPFGFQDVKRNQIWRTNQRRQMQWQRRALVPRPSLKTQPRSWIDRNGVRWTNRRVNDYTWGEREPGVAMDEYNGGPYGWDDVKRDRISVPNSIASPARYMFMDKP